MYVSLTKLLQNFNNARHKINLLTTVLNEEEKHNVIVLIKEKTNQQPFWGECLLHLLYLQDFQVSATITEIAESIILVLGNTSCTAAHWMWIIFHGVMHYYAGFNYRIIDWSFPQNTDLIYFDSKYLQNSFDIIMKYLWYFEVYDLKKDLHDWKGLHSLAVLSGLMHYYTFFYKPAPAYALRKCR